PEMSRAFRCCLPAKCRKDIAHDVVAEHAAPCGAGEIPYHIPRLFLLQRRCECPQLFSICRKAGQTTVLILHIDCVVSVSAFMSPGIVRVIVPVDGHAKCSVVIDAVEQKNFSTEMSEGGY